MAQCRALPGDCVAQTQPANKLIRSSALVGSMTFISRILGLARDVVMAVFGCRWGGGCFYGRFVSRICSGVFLLKGLLAGFCAGAVDYRAGGNIQAVRYLTDRGRLFGFKLVAVVQPGGKVAAPCWWCLRRV